MFKDGVVEVVKRFGEKFKELKVEGLRPKEIDTCTRPKVTLPKAKGLNEIVTLDLMKMGNMYILWIICGFTGFM